MLIMTLAQCVYKACGIQTVFSLADTLTAFFAFKIFAQLVNSFLENEKKSQCNILYYIALAPNFQ